MVVNFRYDFILHANHTDSSAHVMRFAGLFDCSNLEAHAAAVLRYEGAPDEDVLDENTNYEDFLDEVGPVLNALNYAPPPNDAKFLKAEWIPVTELKGIVRPVDITSGKQPRNDSPRPLVDDSQPKKHPALAKEKADKTFYLAYDLYAKDNPHFHDEDLYGYEDVEGGNKLRTPQINNVTLAV